MLLAELLDDEAAPHDVPLLALHDGEVRGLTASPQLVALQETEDEIFSSEQIKIFSSVEIFSCCYLEEPEEGLYPGHCRGLTEDADCLPRTAELNLPPCQDPGGASHLH